MYRVPHENCQTFCLRLLECIRTPMGLRDIFDGLERIPPKLSNEIQRQRCEEFSSTLTASGITVVASLERVPLFISTILLSIASSSLTKSQQRIRRRHKAT